MLEVLKLKRVRTRNGQGPVWPERDDRESLADSSAKKTTNAEHPFGMAGRNNGSE
jgi:hypothetical protein